MHGGRKGRVTVPGGVPAEVLATPKSSPRRQRRGIPAYHQKQTQRAANTLGGSSHAPPTHQAKVVSEQPSGTGWWKQLNELEPTTPSSSEFTAPDNYCIQVPLSQNGPTGAAVSESSNGATGVEESVIERELSELFRRSTQSQRMQALGSFDSSDSTWWRNLDEAQNGTISHLDKMGSYAAQELGPRTCHSSNLSATNLASQTFPSRSVDVADANMSDLIHEERTLYSSPHTRARKDTATKQTFEPADIIEVNVDDVWRKPLIPPSSLHAKLINDTAVIAAHAPQPERHLQMLAAKDRAASAEKPEPEYVMEQNAAKDFQGHHIVTSSIDAQSTMNAVTVPPHSLTAALSESASVLSSWWQNLGSNATNTIDHRDSAQLPAPKTFGHDLTKSADTSPIQNLCAAEQAESIESAAEDAQVSARNFRDEYSEGDSSLGVGNYFNSGQKVVMVPLKEDVAKCEINSIGASLAECESELAASLRREHNGATEVKRLLRVIAELESRSTLLQQQKFRLQQRAKSHSPGNRIPPAYQSIATQCTLDDAQASDRKKKSMSDTGVQCSSIPARTTQQSASVSNTCEEHLLRLARAADSLEAAAKETTKAQFRRDVFRPFRREATETAAQSIISFCNEIEEQTAAAVHRLRKRASMPSANNYDFSLPSSIHRLRSVNSNGILEDMDAEQKRVELQCSIPGLRGATDGFDFRASHSCGSQFYSRQALIEKGRAKFLEHQFLSRGFHK